MGPYYWEGKTIRNSGLDIETSYVCNGDFVRKKYTVDSRNKNRYDQYILTQKTLMLDVGFHCFPPYIHFEYHNFIYTP